MTRAGRLIFVCVLTGCSPSFGELSPATVSQRGGQELLVRTGESSAEGGVVVLVDGIPANSTVIEAPGVVRARLPSLPRSGAVDVEVLFADGTVVTVAGLEVTAPKLDVRARE